jgi:hypothetical protein
MDIRKMIAELHEERARLEEAIISLENLSPMRTSRRGRPPASSRLTSLAAPQNGNGQNGSMGRTVQ